MKRTGDKNGVIKVHNYCTRKSQLVPGLCSSVVVHNVRGKKEEATIVGLGSDHAPKW